MIELLPVPLKKSINKAYLKIKPVREDFENFRKELQKLLSVINEKESEEHNKNFIRDFFNKTFYSANYVNTKGKTDLTIHLVKASSFVTGVIMETKSPVNKSDMISESNLNCKAMHEVILYYLRERIEHRNDEIKNIIITNAYKWFIFKADQFEKYFYKSRLKDEYEKWRDDKKVSSLNEHFYNEIVKKFLNETDAEIEAVYFDLKDFEKKDLDKENEKELIPLFKKFSPPELLKEPFANDSNTLNKQFYSELLHIIGLEEYKEKSKKKIDRKRENRDNGSLIENTIRILKTKDVLKNFDDKSVYGANEEEQLYNIALELNIIWINRILFLKLLEGQLVNYHEGDENYKFLDPNIINQYDDLFELFHQVLAVKIDERISGLTGRFRKIPYLNSSLFELSGIEKKTVDIASLKNKVNLSFYKNTIFGKDVQSKGFLPALDYLLLFLNAFDFASEGSGEILEERKTIINASVLGLIFEKINGYKEGSFYTPGFITMYMARETLRRAIVQKFNEATSPQTTLLSKESGFIPRYKDYEDLKKNLDISSAGREEANKIINSLKICDPAVGSGHFLVSCLNEIIAIKAELRILNYRDGRQIQNYSFEIENDELIITNEETVELLDYHLNPSGKQVTALQDLQEALFHEKETIIENSLFGVDINPNSVNICRLRLWIELLKNAYYTKESNYTELETLPNIDINIKQGNSLISRFKLDIDLSKALKTIKYTIEDYKMFVHGYRTAKNKEEKRNFTFFIEEIKKNFRHEISINDPIRRKLNNLAYELHNKFQAERLIDIELTEQAKKKLKAEEKKLEQEIKQRTKELEAEDKGELYRDAFEWRFEFPEVLDDKGNYKGFDVVIGNPPYISGRDWGEGFDSIKNFYRNNYKTAEYQLDLYQIFIEKSRLTLNPKGIMSLIVPNTWLANHKTEKIRKYILDTLCLVEIVYSFEKIFEEAEVDVILFIASNFKDECEKHKISEIIKKNYFNRNFISQNNYINNEGFIFNIFVIPEHNSILAKIERDAKKLSDLCFINRGIHPYRIDGYGKSKFQQGFQILKDYEERSYHSIKKIDEAYKKELKGKNIFPYYFIESGEYVSYGDWLAEPRELKYFVGDRIYLRKIVGPKGLIACIVNNDQEYVADQSVYIAKPKIKNVKLKYILALLNSRLMGFYFRLKNNEFDRLFPQIKIGEFKQLPIVYVENSSIEIQVDKILLIKQSNPQTDTTSLEKEIDEMVYKLYGLTEEEIKIVEQ